MTTKQAGDAEAGAVGGLQRIVRRIVHIDEIGVISALVVMCLVVGLKSDIFFKRTNLLEVSRQASYVGIMTIGMVFVMSSGNVDLSVGSIYMLSPIVCGLAMQSGINQWVAVLLGLATGVACGFVNGTLSILLKIPMIIVSLGTMSIFRSLGLVASKGFPVYKFSKDTLLFRVGGEFIGPLPASTVVLLILVILGTIFYARTPFGNRIRAAGSNLQAALFSGVQVNRLTVLVMMLQGFLCAVAGILAMLFLRVAEPTAGGGFEMYVIASAIIGGTSLAGGAGSIIGAFIGSLIIAVIRNGLVLLGVHYYWTGFATGAVIIAAVFLDYLIRQRREAQ